MSSNRPWLAHPRNSEALRDAGVELDEAENTAEIVPDVVDVTRRGIGGDDKKGNAKAVLIVALGLRQNDMRFMVVPASPIVR